MVAAKQHAMHINNHMTRCTNIMYIYTVLCIPKSLKYNNEWYVCILYIRTISIVL